jgi:hypothetical protein
MMVFKLIVLGLNEKYLEKYLIDEIISFYYPEFKSLRIT